MSVIHCSVIAATIMGTTLYEMLAVLFRTYNCEVLMEAQAAARTEAQEEARADLRAKADLEVLDNLDCIEGECDVAHGHVG